ncbi:MAG TPA: TonB family protein [Candidatus Methylomirabilis sp.]|nr:TonB family protein [Candidatus Methylomirabilis sp.]
MIPRTLVPLGSRLPAADTPSQRRRPTTLDERTLIPAMLPIVHLDGHSNIPKTLPLESISARVVVPRDVEPEAYRVVEDNSVPIQPTDLDERIAIPQGVAPPETIEAPLIPPADLVDLDVFMTGEVNLLVKPQTERKTKWDFITRVSSVAFHIVVIAAILLQAKLFPPHAPTQEQIDLANRQLTWIPPESSYSVKPTPPPKVATPPVVHVDPKVLRDVAPPIPQPAPKPERPKADLPDAPVPKTQAPPPDIQPPAVKPDAPKAAPSLEVPDMPKPRQGLVLPKNSSARDAINDALKTPSQDNGGKSGAIVGPGPRAASPGGGVSGPGQGTFGNGYQILTDLQGVDFSDYMQRMLETVRRNWYAVMPQSAMLGERGRVMLRFHINADGSVPNGDPLREMSSGKEPLDRAAVSSIRSSNPFEPLPPAFIEAAKRNSQGTYIEIRIIFLYNLPIEAAYQ